MSASVAAGIDLGGTNIKAAIVDRAGAILVRRSVPTDLSGGAAGVVEGMADLTRSMLHELGLERRALVGVGIGSPGPLSPTKGIVYKAANLPGLVGVPFTRMLGEALGAAVRLDNDANLAAYGESWVGAGRGVSDFVFLTLGTGIGGGVILGGKVLHGHHENAGEIGHLIAMPNGLPCNCGQRGCLEQYASASAIARLVKSAIESGERSVLAEAVRRGDAIDSRHVVEAAGKGDALCVRVWDEACLYLALACVNLQHAYNPQRILLGGGMSDAGGVLIETVRRLFREQAWRLHDDFPEIVLAQLGNDAGVIGAGRLAWSVAVPGA